MKHLCKGPHIQKLMGSYSQSSSSPAQRLMRGTQHRFAGGITNSMPDLSVPGQSEGGSMGEGPENGLKRYLGGTVAEPLRRAMGGAGKIRKGMMR